MTKKYHILFNLPPMFFKLTPNLVVYLFYFIMFFSNAISLAIIDLALSFPSLAPRTNSSFLGKQVRTRKLIKRIIIEIYLYFFLKNVFVIYFKIFQAMISVKIDFWYGFCFIVLLVFLFIYIKYKLYIVFWDIHFILVARKLLENQRCISVYYLLQSERKYKQIFSDWVQEF